MNIEEAIKKYQLSDEEFEKNANRIFSALAMNADKPEKPRFIMVGGQAGSGKTGLVAKKNRELDGGAIIIDQDEIRASFPEELYEQILKEHDDREEYLILKPYVLKMRQKLVDMARENGYNVIMESAMQAVDSFIPQIQSFKDAGYETELSVISVPEVDCYLSTLNRYCYYLNKDGICRRNTKMDPQMLVKLRNNIVKLENTGLFDNVDIHIRGNSQTEPPVMIYSKKDRSFGETPLEAFDRGQSVALKTTRRSFNERATGIRETLARFDEKEKLEQLAQIEDEFKNLDDRGDYGE